MVVAGGYVARSLAPLSEKDVIVLLLRRKGAWGANRDRQEITGLQMVPWAAGCRPILSSAFRGKIH